MLFVAVDRIGTGTMYKHHQFAALFVQVVVMELKGMVLQVHDDIQRIRQMSLGIVACPTYQVVNPL